MVIHIRKKDKRNKLDLALKKIKAGKPLDAKKFCGTVKWGEDGMIYQKRLRDEWS